MNLLNAGLRAFGLSVVTFLKGNWNHYHGCSQDFKEVECLSLLF